MADYYTLFSIVLDVKSKDNAKKALTYFEEETDGFEVVQQGSDIWLHDNSNGDVETVVDFILEMARVFDLKGKFGFEYSRTCSKPRNDAYGGGAYLLDLGRREIIRYIDTSEWLKNG